MAVSAEQGAEKRCPLDWEATHQTIMSRAVGPCSALGNCRASEADVVPSARYAVDIYSIPAQQLHLGASQYLYLISSLSICISVTSTQLS